MLRMPRPRTARRNCCSRTSDSMARTARVARPAPLNRSRQNRSGQCRCTASTWSPHASSAEWHNVKYGFHSEVTPGGNAETLIVCRAASTARDMQGVHCANATPTVRPLTSGHLNGYEMVGHYILHRKGGKVFTSWTSIVLEHASKRGG